MHHSTRARMARPSAIAFALFHFISGLGFAQETAQRTPSFERAYERLLERSDEEDVMLLLDQLESFADDPLCLHTARIEDIEELPLITPTLAHDIQRAMHGDSIAGWSVLRRLPGMDRDRYALLRACATLDCAREKRLDDLLEYRGRVQQEDRPRRGFLDGTWAPDRARIQQRIKAQAFGHLRMGLTQERDPGEADFTDHIAGYASLEAVGMIERAVVGDFTVAAGQGLVFWQSFGLSKGSDALSVGKRTTRTLAPYASATEGLFYRGAAAEFRLNSFSIAAFVSRNRLDATIDAETGTAGSFGIDGMHRASSETQRRRSVEENIQGGRLQWEHTENKTGLRMGISGWHANYSAISDPHTPFGFEGNRAWTAGCDATLTIGRASVFGEIALCHLDRGAGILGVRAPLHAQVEALLVWRSYNERFVNIHGFGFGERGGELQNEQGVYLGLCARPAPDVRVDAWMDVFQFPNRTYLLHLPTSGGEMMINGAWDVSESLTLNIRFVHGEKDNTIAAFDELGRDIRPLARRRTTGLRAELLCEASESVRVRVRADRTAVRYDAWSRGDDGLLFLADCRIAMGGGLYLTGRIAMVESGDYDGRVYEFEHDVPGVMQNIAMYGRGTRTYLVVDWKPADQWRVGLKYAYAVRDAAVSIGEGADAVEGDALGKVTAQVEMRLR